jgi:Nucleoside-diphosphate-sugar epimerases
MVSLWSCSSCLSAEDTGEKRIVAKNGVASVAVTGGAGFLGINLIRSLLEKDLSVTSLDKARFDYPEKSRVRVVTGDVRDDRAVAEALDGVDAVVHCAAALPLHAAREIETVGIEGTRVVGSVAVRQGVQRMVHISSTAVYGIPKVHPILEEHELVGVGPYGRTKIAAEEMAASFRSSFPVTILRPKSFIGPERLGVFALLFDWAASGHHFPIPGSGRNLYQYLDVADLVSAIWLSLTAPVDLANDVYNIGAEEFGTFRDDFQSGLGMKLVSGKSVKSLPAMPAILGVARS